MFKSDKTWKSFKQKLADLAQLGERQTEENQSTANLEVLCSIHRVRILFYPFLQKKNKLHVCTLSIYKWLEALRVKFY